jgi:hypothetical protein
MDFGDFARTYKNFYAPCFALKLAGQDLARQGVEIVSVTVDNTLEGADQASFTVSNAFDLQKREIRWFDQEIAVGQELEVRLGYTDVLEPLFIGLITAIKINFPAGGMPQLEVSAFDLSHKMTKNKKSLPWDNKKDSDVATALANLYQFTPKVDDTRVVHATTKQDNESDFDFLTKRAKENDFEFFVFQRTLYFRRPAYQESAVVNLEWGKSLMSFSPELDIADQVEEVEVRGWDLKAKKEIIGKAKVGDEEGRDQRRKSGGEMVKGIAPEKIVERVRWPVMSQEEADKLAKSILGRLSEGLVKGSGECLGLPQLLAGKNISLMGLGKKFSKTYYMEKTNHSISSSGYRTTFSIKEPTI